MLNTLTWIFPAPGHLWHSLSVRCIAEIAAYNCGSVLGPTLGPHWPRGCICRILPLAILMWVLSPGIWEDSEMKSYMDTAKHYRHVLFLFLFLIFSVSARLWWKQPLFSSRLLIGAVRSKVFWFVLFLTYLRFQCPWSHSEAVFLLGAGLRVIR